MLPPKGAPPRKVPKNRHKTVLICPTSQTKGPDNPTCLCFCSRARVIAHAILQVSVRMCVGWCVLVCVCVCAFLCVGWYVPPEVRVVCCALCVRVRVHVCARQRVLLDRRFRFDHVFGRPSRARANNTASLVVRQLTATCELYGPAGMLATSTASRHRVFGNKKAQASL